MEPQHKRTLIATVACLFILFGWMKLQEILYPTRAPDATSAPTGPVDSQPTSAERSFVTTSGAASESKTSAEEFSVVPAQATPPVTLGDDRQDPSNPFEFSATVSPRGAAVESIWLARYRNHVAKDKRHPDHDPYDLVRPVNDPAKGARFDSFATQRILMVDENRTIDLGDVSWSLEKKTDDTGDLAVLKATIQKSARPVLAITKTFHLAKGAPHLEGSVSIENLSSQPRRIVVTERGAIGFKNEDPQRESRRFSSALAAIEKDEKGTVKLDAKGQPVTAVAPGDYGMRAELAKLPDGAKELRPGEKHLLWTAVGNKYFGCIQTWLPLENSSLPYAEYLAKAVGRAYLDDPDMANDLTRVSDLTVEQSLSPMAPLAPGKVVTMRFEVYCGAKSDTALGRLGPLYRARHYELVTAVDRKGGCTFDVLTDVMLWLLRTLYALVRNYGVAIILMVIIVRLILHPLTKRSQISMMRMQKGMAALKPKLDAIQEQCKNDRQKLNEETMKLYREEGINPASSMLGCLPMFLQMPIWVALWTSLNTNVDLRHQPFFLWIRDLSIPDGLFTPAEPWSLRIPLLSAITGTINGFNLLPIIMAATMYAQQKFMQKLTKPATPPAPKLDAEGRPMPDQMAQQQKMMNFMMIFFGAMLYNQPAGLNLYIFCSSLLGMLEQWQIKRHIKKIDERGDFAAKRTGPKPPSFFERLQKRAEDIRRAQGSGELRKMRKPRKQPRF